MLYMFQVKCEQINKLIEMSETSVRRKSEQEKMEKEKERSKPLFVADNKSKRNLFKNRDLVNPERKRRKKNGAKLGSGYEETMILMENQ